MLLKLIDFYLKVLLEKTSKGTKVGYIFNTHLQAYQGTNVLHIYFKIS